MENAGNTLESVQKELEQAHSRIAELEASLKTAEAELKRLKPDAEKKECISAQECKNHFCPVHGNLTIVRGEPLPSVPMPDKLPPLDYYSQEEGRRRGYCR